MHNTISKNSNMSVKQDVLLLSLWQMLFEEENLGALFCSQIVRSSPQHVPVWGKARA